MEKRKTRRKKFEKIALINNFPCVLPDISKEGLRISADQIPSFPDVLVTFQLGNCTIRLKGEIRWEGKIEKHTHLREVGMAIQKAPQEFYQYYENLPYVNNFRSSQDH